MQLFYTYYGDDFTGSTDVLEQLAANGVPAVLFLREPSAAQVAAFPGVRAIGIAGDSRSRTPAWMDAHLPAIFRALGDLGAPVVHYKVCSTFDSSPEYGSIGRALELGIEALRPRFVPVVVGAPHLRRYVAFGQLFAAGPDGALLRIDRHPMALHPVTPMREADLRLHLAAQTAAKIGLLDLTGLTAEALEAELALGCAAVLFDTVDMHTLRAAGSLIWQEAQRRRVFSASSSGLTSALLAAWRAEGLLQQPGETPAQRCVGPLLVVSGSCSAVTERQIHWALRSGFQGFHLKPHNVEQASAAVARALAEGRDTVVYTALGTPDSAAHGDTLGTALGRLIRDVRRRTHVARVLLCGGDTSSHAVQQLALYALTWKASLQPGAPLCEAYGGEPLELVLKGGQVGTEDFFDVVRTGAG